MTDAQQPGGERPVLTLLSQVLVPLAALFVAGASVIVAVEAKDISEKQTQIAARQLQPVITASLAYNFVDGKARDQAMTVSDVGGPASGVSTETVTLLTLRYSHDAETATLVVPLYHYYPAMLSTGKPSGVLATAEGVGNNAAEYALETQAAELASAQRVAFDVSLSQYARVSYTDELGLHHTDYLSVDAVSGSAPMSSDEGSKIFALQARGEAGEAPSFDLDTVKPRTVLSYAVSHAR